MSSEKIKRNVKVDFVHEGVTFKRMFKLMSDTTSHDFYFRFDSFVKSSFQCDSYQILVGSATPGSDSSTMDHDMVCDDILQFLQDGTRLDTELFAEVSYSDDGRNAKVVLHIKPSVSPAAAGRGKPARSSLASSSQKRPATGMDQVSIW